MRHALTAALAVVVAQGCSREGGGTGGDTSAALRTRAGSLALAASPYQPRAVADGGRVHGRVTLEGEPPGDTTSTPISDQRICGQTVRERLAEVSSGRVAGAVVWLAELRSGKPLPETKRFELAQERCVLSPRVQAALAGGTLNVRNADPIQHRLRFLRNGTDEVLALVRHYDEGEVVPSDTVLRRSGMVEVRCDMHPWTRAWVAVFDHPYYAVTEPDGAFSLDSVPPGTYKLVAWHPRLGEVEREVVIAAGGAAEAPMTLRLAK